MSSRRHGPGRTWMRPVFALPFALAALSLAVGVDAAPPEPGPEVGADPGEFVVDPWLIPGGFWLSVELIGPRGAQIDGARSLRQEDVVDALPRAGAPPPGELVGRVDTLEQALRWLDQSAFAPLDPAPLDTAGEPLPIPGGQLWREHGLVLTSLVLTHTAPGPGGFPWPPANVLPLPEGVDWQPASLAVERTPMFAAPAPNTIPAAERYRIARIDHAIWQLGVHERCTDGADTCLRWARILVREGERFFGGFVPASHVVPDDAWVGGPGERRFALLASDRTHDSVGYVLLEQRGSRREAPVGLRHPHVGPGWPEAGVDVLGEELLVLIGGEPKLRRHLDTPATPTF